MDDVLINKADTIERCVARVREEYDFNPDSFENSEIILNPRLTTQYMTMEVNLAFEFNSVTTSY